MEEQSKLVITFVLDDGRIHTSVDGDNYTMSDIVGLIEFGKHIVINNHFNREQEYVEEVATEEVPEVESIEMEITKEL